MAQRKTKDNNSTMERNNGPSYFPRRHGQEEKEKKKRHNAREDKEKIDRPKTTTATEVANKANETKLNNASKQRQ